MSIAAVIFATSPSAVVGGLASTLGVAIGLVRLTAGSTRRPLPSPPISGRTTGPEMSSPHRLRRRRTQGGQSTASRTRVGLWAASTMLGLALVGPFAVAITAFVVIAFRRSQPVLAQRATDRRVARQVPDALDLFVLLLDTGLPTRRCIEELAHRGPRATRPGFAEVSDHLQNGAPFAEAIVSLRHRLGSDVVALVELVAASDRAGLPMSQVVHQMSSEARAARRRRDQAAARVLPVKLSFPLVFCTLPSFVLLAIAPAVMAALSSLGSNSW